MWEKSPYYVQYRTRKGWRYYTKSTDFGKAKDEYIKALKKHHQARIVNVAEYGIRVVKGVK